MPEEVGVLFDPEEDGKPKPILTGTFPAHITGYKEGNAVNGSIPYNVEFKIAKVVGEKDSEFKGVNWQAVSQDNPSGEEVDASYMAGRTVRSIGIWFNPDPKPEERWKNRDYVNFLESIGIELPETEQGGKKYKTLVTLEESEAIGRPCIVTIRLESDKRAGKSDNKYPKVFSVQTWEDGKRIDVTEGEEDVFSTPELETE